MHEWALAESVIATVVQEAKKYDKKILNVKLKIGELQQIDLDRFKFALENVVQPYEPALNMEMISIKIDKSLLKCRVCGNNWSYCDNIKDLEKDKIEAIHFIPEIAHVYMRCPQCGSPDFEIIQGRGVWFESIVGEK